MSLASILRRCGLASAATGLVALLSVSGAGAQSESSTPVDSPAGVVPSQPVPMVPSASLPGVPADGATGVPADGATGVPAEAPGLPPAPQPAYAPAYTTDRSVLEVIWASIFDDIWSPEAQAARPWTPLPLATFFTEGWDQPFVLPPPGSGGANRIGWINAFGGVFFRAWFFESFYAVNAGHNGNQFIQDFTIFVPFNRRFEIQFDSLFIVSNKGGSSNTYHTNWGDTTIYPRFLLSESKDFGQILQMGIRMPTGRTENSNGVTSLQPQYQIWWNPFGHWAVRASTGPIIPVAKNSGYTQYYNLLGIGWSNLGNPDKFIHNYMFYLLAEDTATVTGTPRRENVFTLLPGFLTQLGKSVKPWFGYYGIQVPMTGPKAYDYQMIWAVVHGY